MANVRSQRLADHLFVPIIHAGIIHTAVKEGLGVHVLMTCSEQFILSSESTTEGLSLIELQLTLCTDRAIFLTDVTGRIFVLVRCLPALAPFYHRGDCFTSSVFALIGTITIEVTTQTADAVVVAARQLDDQVPIPIIGDYQAKICLYHYSAPPLKHGHLGHLTLAELHRKIQKLPVNLERKGKCALC